MVAAQAQPLYANCINADVDGHREYEAVYQVQTTSRSDGPITARDAPGIPRVNDSFAFGNDFDLGAFATQYASNVVEYQDTLKLWEVRVRYESAESRRNDDNYEDNPLNRAPIISGDALRYTDTTTKDGDGNLIQNSADEALPVERDNSRPILRIQINQATLNLNQLREYTDTLNSQPFFGLAAGKWKMAPASWEQTFQGSGQPIYRVFYQFESNLDGWDVEPIDEGWTYIATGNVRKVMDDDNGIPTNARGYLDGGDKLTTGSTPITLPKVSIYKSKDFANLGIPTQLGP